MNRDLVLGDIVMLSPSTSWDLNAPWNPLNTRGEVVVVTEYDIYVRWDTYASSHSSHGGIRYQLRDSDLIKQVAAYKFKTRDAAREALKERPSCMTVVDLGEGEEDRWSIETKEI